MVSRGQDRSRHGNQVYRQVQPASRQARPMYHGPLVTSFPSGALPFKPDLRHSGSPWKHWVELTVRVKGLPCFQQGPELSTLDVYKAFREHGEIMRIDFEEDEQGRQNGGATITFMPPPKEPFWLQETLKFRLPDGAHVRLRLSQLDPKRTFLHPSPVNPDRKFRERLVCDSFFRTSAHHLC